MKKTYIIANVFWLVLSIAVCLESWRLDVGGLHTPGPGFLPFYAAILLGVLALISLIQTLKKTEGPATGIWGGSVVQVGFYAGRPFYLRSSLKPFGFRFGDLSPAPRFIPRHRTLWMEDGSHLFAAYDYGDVFFLCGPSGKPIASGLAGILGKPNSRIGRAYLSRISEFSLKLKRNV
jgi:hypothetical protein